VTNGLSDFTNKIRSERDYKLFVQNKEDKDVNKVLVFSKRENVAPAIKALSAEFRDRLRISVVSVPDSKSSEYAKELMKDYEIEQLPKLVVE